MPGTAGLDPGSDIAMHAMLHKVSSDEALCGMHTLVRQPMEKVKDAASECRRQHGARSPK